MQNTLKKCFILLISIGLVMTSPAQRDVSAAANMDVYTTIHAAGITITINSADDPNRNLVVTPWYKRSGESVYQEGFPLTRVSTTRLVGSLFWLDPAATYDVELRFIDPDGGNLHNTILAGNFITQSEPTIPSPTKQYIVSPAGSGTTCSLASPCSLSQAISLAGPGEAVNLRGGRYYEGEFDLPRSGAKNTPIIIRGYAGETAIIDGSDPLDFTWVTVGGGVFRTTVNEADPHLVVANGQRLLPYLSLSDLQNLVWNTPGFYADDTSVYVRLAGNADPNTQDMRITRFNHAFYVNQDYIVFDNLTFQYFGLGSYAKALYFYNASNNLVNNSTFFINDLAIGIKYASSRNVFQNNVFSDTLFDWPWDAFYNGISLSSGGIRFYSPASGRGNIIRENTFHDYFDGFGACPTTTGSDTNETDVYNNLIYRTADDGMETDGTCSNVRIWGNTFYDTLVGISLAPVYVGPVYAIRNLIYNTGMGNNDYSGTPFKFNSGYDQSGSMYLFHNTADAVLPGNNGLYVKAPGSWDLIFARNNIWSGTDYAINNYNESQPIDLDYDNLYTTRSDEFVYWGSDANRHMSDLPTFQTLTGQELHGINQPSGFLNAAIGDYSLSDSSRLINAGVFLPGINSNYLGSAPDIGAYEYEEYGISTTFFPRVVQLRPGQIGQVTLNFTPLGGYDEMVLVGTSSPSPDLSVALSIEQFTAPATATLTISDFHVTPLSAPGLWFYVPVTLTGVDFEDIISVPVLIGGRNLFLPVIHH